MLGTSAFLILAFALAASVMLAAGSLFPGRDSLLAAAGEAKAFPPPQPLQNHQQLVPPPPPQTVKSTRSNATQTHARRASEVDPAYIEICFLALGAAVQMDRSTTIIRNIEAHSSHRSLVRYHLLVDQSTTLLRGRMRFSGSWRGLPRQRVVLHAIDAAPPLARRLYRELSRTATGPGPIYLYKPLLHLVLPLAVKRVIVLDTDLFLTSDIAGLWAEFDRFAPDALLGLAVEQCPSYQQVRRLGGVGLNGGVQLLDLAKMRRSARYAELLDGYMERPMRYPMKEGGIGWLGDQTLYSWMSVNATGGRNIFHLLPCGWNRQIGTHMAGWKGFWQAHACSTPCYLIHGNYVAHKSFMESLKQDPTGATCRAIVARHRRSDRIFRPGSADARMLDVVETTCCPGN